MKFFMLLMGAGETIWKPTTTLRQAMNRAGGWHRCCSRGQLRHLQDECCPHVAFLAAGNEQRRSSAFSFVQQARVPFAAAF